MRHVLGGSAWRSRKAFRCGRARGKEDQRVRLYRYCGAEAFDSTRLSGEGQRRRVGRHSALEWSIRKVLEVAEAGGAHDDRSEKRPLAFTSGSSSELTDLDRLLGYFLRHNHQGSCEWLLFGRRKMNLKRL